MPHTPPRRRLWPALALCGCAVACGGTVVPGTTYDRALFAFSTMVKPAGGLASARDRADTGPAARPLITLLWTDPLQRQPDRPSPAYAIQSSVSAADDTAALEIFRPPPPEALVDIASATGDSARLAVAEIVLIDDADGDGTFRVSGARAEIAEPDQYLAGSQSLLVYVARPLASPATDFPLVATGGTGYQLISYACAGQIVTGVNPVAADMVEMILRPSIIFPEVRTCRRSHSP